jgi:hypothetical protein
VLFRLQKKERIVLVANTLAVAGLALLALGMTGAILFVTDFVLGHAAAAAVTAAVLLAFAGVWYLIPLRQIRPRGPN